MKHSSINILLLTSLCFATVVPDSVDHEAALVSHLKTNISGHSPLLRPIRDPHAVLGIGISGMVAGLVAVDSAKQSVKIAALVQVSWREERLVWDPAKFGNVTVLNWDSANSWFPVILIYNGIGENQLLTPQIPIFLTSISSNTTVVTASWRRDIEFTCRFEMTRFPVDRHTCELEFFFSDQGHNNRLIRPVLSPQPFDVLGAYRENGEWEMLNASTTVTYRHYKLFAKLPKVALPTFVISIDIKRVSAYYFMNVITPLLLLTLLQVLLYFVPLESGEKLGFGITIMLSYTVFLLLIDDIVPKSRSTPAVASFITAAMILSTASLLLTSLIMRFHFSPEGTRMVTCARAVFVGFLGRLFCVTGAGRSAQIQQVDDASQTSVRKMDEDVQSKGEVSRTGLWRPTRSRGSWWLWGSAAHSLSLDFL